MKQWNRLMNKYPDAMDCWANISTKLGSKDGKDLYKDSCLVEDLLHKFKIEPVTAIHFLKQIDH